MFQLKYLEASNFFSFESFAIRFTKGMTLISGYDEQGKDSNGCGKSTILNAICWALFGRTLKGVQGQDVVRWGCKNCKVILVMEGEGHVYEITRSPDSIRFNIDGSVVRGHIRDIQSAIETTFKTNFALFIRSTAFSQSQVDFLAAAGDTEKKRLFKEILSLSRLDTAYDKVRNRYEFQCRRAENLESELASTEKQRTNLENKIQEAEALKESWEETIKSKIQGLKGKKQRPPKPIELIDSDIKKYTTQLKEFENIDNDILAEEKRLQSFAYDESGFTKEIEKLRDLIDRGQGVGSRCELCGSIVNKKMMGAHRKEIEEQISTVSKQKTLLAKERFDTHELLSHYYSVRLEQNNLQNQLEIRKRDLAITEIEWRHYLEDCKSIDTQIQEVENAINPYDAIYTAHLIERDNLNSQLERTQKEFETTKRLIDTLAFVKFTFSREGAVGHIIEREYATLMSYANHLLSEISGGHLRLSINPQRELKSGVMKEEIDITVYSNEQKTTYWGLSGGQQQRVNIALLLSLNKLCKMKGVNSFDFLLLDEVLDLSLAEGGQQDVLFLLKNYLREVNTILLISHKETFKTSFTSCLSVYRDNEGISRLGR